MRIIHTSDWHLGQHFMGKTRQAEHQGFLSWLIQQVSQHSVDAVIVAGDIFDTGTPPSYARELYNHFIVELQHTGATLVVLGGNHDSAAMLGESRSLLACLNTHVIPAAADDALQQVITLKSRNGEPAALLCAVPYLRPRDILQSLPGQSGDDKGKALQDAIRTHYQQLYELAQAQQPSGRTLPVIGTGHLMTSGSDSSEAVRDIYVGTLENYPADAFPPFDYIALGHIHRPQQVAGRPHIRYSGSPIPLAFDEATRTREVLLVEFAGKDLSSVTPLPVPCFQPLLSVRGSLESLPDTINTAMQDFPPETTVWLEVTVTAEGYLADLQTPLRAMTEHLAVEILRVKRERHNQAVTLQSDTSETLDELTPLDVFRHRMAPENIDPPLRERLENLFNQVVEHLGDPAP